MPYDEDPELYDLSIVRGLPLWVRLPKFAVNNTGLLTRIEDNDPEGGVYFVGDECAGFIYGTLARARDARWAKEA